MKKKALLEYHKHDGFNGIKTFKHSKHLSNMNHYIENMCMKNNVTESHISYQNMSD